MATTKSATSVEDSNDIDTTTSSPHLLDGIDNVALKVGRSGGLCLWWKDGTTIQISLPIIMSSIHASKRS
ncbi:hypothetical protein ACFX1R_001714 [Malus domestica]